MIGAMRARFLLAAVALAAPAAANDLPPLPLQPGQYASEEFDCKDAPFAGLFFYDGRSVSGPHTGGCVSRTMAVRGATFEVSTGCTKNGDGSPATPTRLREIYRILSPTRVERAQAASPSITHIYRWCASLPVRK